MDKRTASIASCLICLTTAFATLENATAASVQGSQTGVRIEVQYEAKGDVDPRRIVAALTPLSAAPSAIARTEIVQSNAQFRPFVAAAQRGSELAFPNQDEFAHHVYSFSKAMSFELPLYGKNQEQTLKLEDTGVVVLGCNIHDWMLGYLLIVDTPYFAFLDENVATLERVPVGAYTLTLWHPSMSEAWEQPVTVQDAETRLNIDLPIPLKPVHPLPTPTDIDEDY